MAIATVQSRGQVTLPKEVRDTLGIRPGDKVMIHPTGTGKAEIEVIPTMSLEEFIEQFRSDQPYDDAKVREEWQRDAAEELMQRIRRGDE